MAKLTKAIWGADAGAHSRWHEAGEECPPALEAEAEKAGALEAKKAPEKK